MRNLIRVHFKRYLFRWEVAAVTIWNLMLSCISVFLATQLYLSDVPFEKAQFSKLFAVFLALSLGATLTSVIFMESANFSSGALRNFLLGGYTKAQVFLSKYLVTGIFGAIQGALFLLPVTVLKIEKEYTAFFFLSILLTYIAVSCIAVTGFLLTPRQTLITLCTILGLLLLTSASNLGTSALDIEEFYYAPSQTNPTKIESTRDFDYVPSPARDVLEQTIRILPMQAVNEHILWYIPLNMEYLTYYERTSSNEQEDTLMKLRKQQTEAYLNRHLRRIRVLPCYQLAAIIIIAAGGTLLFRKRNLK